MKAPVTGSGMLYLCRTARRWLSALPAKSTTTLGLRQPRPFTAVAKIPASAG